MSVKLRDIVENLVSRGKKEEADYYRLIVAFELMLKHGLSENDVLNMTVDEIEMCYKMPPKPEKYRGWNFWWGEAAYK